MKHAITLEDRVHDCLTRLMPHLDRRRVALTGGVAIALHLGSGARRRVGAGRPPGDVDFVAEAVDAVAPTAVEDFLVSHFHLPQPGYAKFLVQLVDPVSRLRIDIFPDARGALPRARWCGIADASLLVLDPCSILDHKLAILARASAAAPVDEKHHRDARILGALCGRQVPDRPTVGLRATAYSQDITATCTRCAASSDARFPLAEKRRVRDVLGYV